MPLPMYRFLLALLLLTGSPLYSQPLYTGPAGTLRLVADGQPLLSSPPEGLWSIATGWADWPTRWHHTSPDSTWKMDDWQFFSGRIRLPQGDWILQDAYRQENGRVRCIRRFHWTGKETLDSITLSVRWQAAATGTDAFLPGILYYGNPSGERNGPRKVVTFHGLPGESVLLEEHRFPMPFACGEWQVEDKTFGAALHALPSPVAGGNRPDQWWSLGLSADSDHTEWILLSGPVAYNGHRNVVKALQEGFHHYGDTWMKVPPGTVIEKTCWLEAFRAPAPGTAFQQPVHTAIDLFRPFHTDDLPPMDDILAAKYRFARSRWLESPDYAGFNMFPPHVRPQIVLGWAGQCEAPGYALQALADRLGDTSVWDMVQRSMDHICSSPLGPGGFPVVYDIGEKTWKNPDPVSEGQAMNSIALAIRTGRSNGKVKTGSWESFLKDACRLHAARIRSDDWRPVNTAEAFYIAPLLLAAELFRDSSFSVAALKAADHYILRHLSMQEPYWGGTLDATCEDKEGAWGAFQGFLAAYEHTHEPRYLSAARHAADVVLSYLVVWDIPLPPGRMADHAFKSRGWTVVSAQNQHLDVYGVIMVPAIHRLGLLTQDNQLLRLSAVMYRSCGQMIAPSGAHGEQLQHTNFAQHGDMSDVDRLRGGYSEQWTVFWITAHFLHAAAQLEEMGVRF
ncbi:MAG: hypothetical protein RLY31_2231 [Bacteroidota bacterium]|jgi:hypothetical protein